MEELPDWWRSRCTFHGDLLVNHWNVKYIKSGIQIFVCVGVCIFSLDDSVEFLFVFMPNVDVVSKDGANIASSLALLSDDEDIVTKLFQRKNELGKRWSEIINSILGLNEK